MSLVLHGYWRSSAAYRIRIALNLKAIVFDQKNYDLRTGAQRGEDYLALAPAPLVPALEADGAVFTQSLAILEWLEERHPSPALLPRMPDDRAIVRAMASLVACDIHPVNNLRVQGWLRANASANDALVQRWIAHWIGEGFTALERLVGRHHGRYCFGDMITIADCVLVPQIYNARRFGVDLDPYPTLTAVDARCMALDAFDRARPERQPDADGASL